MDNSIGSIVYLSHGGGPLPLLGDISHLKMIEFMKQLSYKIKRPEAIIVFSAHWEENIPTILGSDNPGLLYDYYGFPDETYNLHYHIPTSLKLRDQIINIFKKKNVDIKVDNTRGFDHGVFIPLLLMYPENSIPTIQISLIKGLDPLKHLELGKLFKELLNENILVIGSGFSFHNMSAFTWKEENHKDEKNDMFQENLIKLCTDETYIHKRENLLIDWDKIPNARYCHPREEHLLPLHVCLGMTEKPGKLVFDDYIIGKRSIALLWQ